MKQILCFSQIHLHGEPACAWADSTHTLLTEHNRTSNKLRTVQRPSVHAGHTVYIIIHNGYLAGI